MNHLKFISFNYYSLRKLMFLILFVFLIPVLSPCAVKTKNGSESALKLSDYISEQSKSEINIFQTATGVYSEQSIPRILLTRHENPTLILYNGTKLIHFDYRESKILNTFLVSGKNIGSILSGPAADKIYIAGEDFSQFDLNTGKIDWTKDFGLSGGFFLNLPLRGISGYYRFPIMIKELPENDQVMVMGLLRKKTGLLKSPDYSNKIMVFNSKTGEMVSDREFQYRRKLAGSNEIFINTSNWEFEILDVDTLECLLKGKLNPMDLLFPYEHIAVDRKRLSIDLISVWSGGNLGNWKSGIEFSAHFLGKGFILTSRDCYDTSGAVKTSKWVIFDDKGNKVKSIFPAPLTSIDFAVNNLGMDEWPIYMPHTFHRKIRRARVDKIIALEKDGSYSEIELPAIEGMDEFMHLSVNNWFHMGDTFYYTKDGNINKFKLGDKTGELIYKSDKADDCDTVEAWDANYIMLRPFYSYGKQKNAILIRFSDGKKIKPEEYNENLDTLLWKLAVDFNQSGLPLPETGATPEFKSYMDYSHVRDFEGETKRSNKVKIGWSYQMFKVWGDYRMAGKYGDIGIVPATMKDKSTALIGINIADNKPLFSVPVLEFSGLPDEGYYPVFPEGRYLPFNIIRLNENEALLIVFEKIDLLKIYKLKRP